MREDLTTCNPEELTIEELKSEIDRCEKTMKGIEEAETAKVEHMLSDSLKERGLKVTRLYEGGIEFTTEKVPDLKIRITFGTDHWNDLHFDVKMHIEYKDEYQRYGQRIEDRTEEEIAKDAEAYEIIAEFMKQKDFFGPLKYRMRVHESRCWKLINRSEECYEWQCNKERAEEEAAENENYQH